MKTLFSAFIFCLVTSSSLFADLSVPNFFSDHMVLQREQSAAIWGTADPNAEVSVSFKKETAKATAGADGKWRAEIPTGAADATGAELKISSGDDVITIADVLVGEVWFASGQSNMVFSMNRVPDYAELIKKSNYPQIRMFNAAMTTATEPQADIAGVWNAATPKSIPLYSAVAYFFAVNLHEELEIPIGVIKSAWGGKPVETFTSREALNTNPGTKALVDAAVVADASYDAKKAQANYETKLDQWEAALAERNKLPKEKRKRMAKKPTRPKRPLNTEGKPGVLFDAMIHPFVGYTMRGAIWYQGEGNAKTGAVPYDQTLPLMINDWRKRWANDFSFYYVQLANFKDVSTEPGNNDPWPLLQDRMRLVLETTPKTGMAIINDVGEAKDIHPKNKHDVGKRLALWALAKDYGKEITYSGPLFKSHEIKEGAIHVTFDQAGDGLAIREGGSDLKRFEIAGKDNVWHWAEATVTGKDTVVVSSGKVESPVAVRYAWAANPIDANLVNSEGLPASVFRTDDWDDVIVKVDQTAVKAQSERRALAVEIKALAAKKKDLDRTSDEFKTIAAKQAALLKKFKAMAPQPAK